MIVGKFQKIQYNRITLLNKEFSMAKKKKTKVEKITKMVTWVMLIAILVSAGITLALSLAQYLK